MNEPNSSSALSLKPDEPGLAEAEQELSASQERFRAIYTTIRERIALLDYAPDERLSEGDLADEFGVSRTPVRRVLARLEAEGLVESRHGVGTFVTSLDIEELRDIYRLRTELATCIGHLAPKQPTPEIIAAMEAIRKQCRLVAGSDNPKKAFARINIDFFEEVMKLVGNQPLREMLELLFYRTARMWPSMTTIEVIAEEAKIFSAEIKETIRFLKAGNVDAVGHLRRCHISMAFMRLESYVTSGTESP